MDFNPNELNCRNEKNALTIRVVFSLPLSKQQNYTQPRRRRPSQAHPKKALMHHLH